MLLRRIGPAGLPDIPMAEITRHRNVDDPGAEEALLADCLASACDTIGEMSGRVLASETWEVCDWHFPAILVLPKSPVTALVSITWLDAAEAEQTATLADFALIQSDDKSMVKPKPGKAWPTALADRPDALRVRFTAGYTTLPGALKAPVLRLLGSLYDDRELGGADVMEQVQAMVGLHKLNWFAA